MTWRHLANWSAVDRSASMNVRGLGRGCIKERDRQHDGGRYRCCPGNGHISSLPWSVWRGSIGHQRARDGVKLARIPAAGKKSAGTELQKSRIVATQSEYDAGSRRGALEQ